MTDFDPAVVDTGLFWTEAIDDKFFKIDTGKGEASWKVKNYPIPDYGTVQNAIVDGDTVDSMVSFELHWKGVQRKVTIDDSNNKGSFGFSNGGWGGKFSLTGATSEWSASQTGFSFQSGPPSASVPSVAILGEEKNGTFFK